MTFAVFFLTVASCTLASSTFCAVALAAGKKDSGDLYVTASIGEPSTLLPPLASDSASGDVTGRIFNGLVRYNPKLELEGDLAESWDIQDEGKTIVFHLRHNVTWHDGAPFTARDVEFTYQKVIDPNVPTPYSGDFLNVASLEVLGNWTVRVKYAEAFSPALSSWGMAMIPKHLLEHEDFLKTSFARSPIGTGPYRFKRWIDGNRVEMSAFDGYWEGRPKVEGVIYRIIPDQTTMFMELHQQTLDSMGLSPLQYLKLTGTPFFQKNFNKYRYPSLGYTYLGYNLKHEFFTDVRVREALDLAIDKQEIIDGVLMGLGRISTGPFTPESWAYNPAVAPSKYDPVRARALLAEAGWVDSNHDGVLEKNGKKFEFTIITNQGNFQRKLAAEIIQRRFLEVGVLVKIKVIEWSSFLKEFIDKRRYDAVLMAWGLALDPDPHDIWHSSKTKEGEFNFISYSNPRVDTLIEIGRRTFDTQIRAEAYHEIHRILDKDKPVSFLWIADALPILHSRFGNVRLTALGLGYGFVDWEVAAEDRKYSRYEL